MTQDITANIPETLRQKLPGQALDVYKEAFQSAWDRYKVRKHRENRMTREQVAHSFALSQIENQFAMTEKGWKAV